MDRALASRRARSVSPVAPADSRLVKRAVSGERGAFGQLYQLHVDDVFHYVCFRVRDPALAEDLTQDVFVQAFRAIGGLRDPGKFRPWLFTIAHHRLLNHWRDASARPDAADEAGAVSADGEVAAGAPDPVAAADLHLGAQAALAATARLTDLQRQVIALRFVSGLDVAQTAAVMGRSPNAIKNLQHEGLAALRRLLGAQEARR